MDHGIVGHWMPLVGGGFRSITTHLNTNTNTPLKITGSSTLGLEENTNKTYQNHQVPCSGQASRLQTPTSTPNEVPEEARSEPGSEPGWLGPADPTGPTALHVTPGF